MTISNSDTLNIIKEKEIVIFGTGKLAIELLESVPLFFKNIKYFLDNDPLKSGKRFCGRKVYTPDYLLENGCKDIFIIIASMYYDDISSQLVEMGLKENENFISSNEFTLVITDQRFKPGHFYSPIPSISDVKERESIIFDRSNKDIKGISLNEIEQIELFKEFSTFYKQFPYINNIGNGKLRYHFKNGYFEHSDSFFLYAMIRYLNPKKIIEVGSGFSSALILDTNEVFFDNEIDCTFIEPYPDRLKKLLTNEDTLKSTLIESPIQEVELELFTKLEEGDILFIDSSHISKAGSDVNYILFEVLPFLNKGVHIHFHDVFYPFEYPKDWIYKGVFWNEAYILHAFLQYNHSFEIIIWDDFLSHFHKNLFEENTPILLENTGASLWIKKV